MRSEARFFYGIANPGNQHRAGGYRSGREYPKYELDKILKRFGKLFRRRGLRFELHRKRPRAETHCELREGRNEPERNLASRFVHLVRRNVRPSVTHRAIRRRRFPAAVQCGQARELQNEILPNGNRYGHRLALSEKNESEKYGYVARCVENQSVRNRTRGNPYELETELLKNPPDFRGIFIFLSSLFRGVLYDHVFFHAADGSVGIAGFERNGKPSRFFVRVGRRGFGGGNASVSEIPRIRFYLSARAGYVEVDSGAYDSGRNARVDLQAFGNVFNDDRARNRVFRSVVLDYR